MHYGIFSERNPAANLTNVRFGFIGAMKSTKLRPAICETNQTLAENAALVSEPSAHSRDLIKKMDL